MKVCLDISWVRAPWSVFVQTQNCNDSPISVKLNKVTHTLPVTVAPANTRNYPDPRPPLETPVQLPRLNVGQHVL